MPVLSCLLGTLVAYKVFRIGYRIYPYYLQSHQLASDKYVLISGATGGIGKQFAKYLAYSNVPIVLIGRSQSKLSLLTQELLSYRQQQSGKYHHTQSVPKYLIKSICMDFSKLSSAQFWQCILSLGLPQKSIVGYINCCGEAHLSRLADIPESHVTRLKSTNIHSVEYFLSAYDRSQMMADSPFLINCSSMAAHYPLQYSAYYSATKAYASNLIMAFCKESHKNKQLLVLNVQPWYVVTGMIGNKSSWDSVQASQIPQGVMSNLGRKISCAGTLKHELIAQFEWLFSSSFNRRIHNNYERMLKILEARKKKSKKNP